MRLLSLSRIILSLSLLCLGYFGINAKASAAVCQIQKSITIENQVLSVGECRSGGVSYLYAKRTDTDGKLDTSFGNNGESYEDVGDHSFAIRIDELRYEDGFINISGKATNLSTDDFVIDFQVYLTSSGMNCSKINCNFPVQNSTLDYKNPTSLLVFERGRPQSHVFCVTTENGIRCFTKGKYPGSLKDISFLPNEILDSKLISSDEFGDFCASVSNRVLCYDRVWGSGDQLSPSNNPPKEWGNATQLSLAHGTSCGIFSGWLKCWSEEAIQMKPRYVGSILKLLVINKDVVCWISATKALECEGSGLNKKGLEDFLAHELNIGEVRDLSNTDGKLSVLTSFSLVRVLGPMTTTIWDTKTIGVQYSNHQSPSHVFVSHPFWMIFLDSHQNIISNHVIPDLAYGSPLIQGPVRDLVQLEQGGCAVADGKVQCYGQFMEAN
jgi:hypothetical protein